MVIYTFVSNLVSVSSTATLRLHTNLSPRIRISGPVMLSTETLSASGLVMSINSPNPLADCSFSSCVPFRIPSLKIGKTGVIP